MTYQIVTRHLLGEVTVQNSEYLYEDKTYKGAEFKIILPIA